MSFSEVVYNVTQKLSNWKDEADSKVNKIFRITPKGSEGINGETTHFLFDYLGDVNLSMNADITDHYTEENKFFQDHIVLKPKKITLSGFVAEVVDTPPSGIAGLPSILQDKLTTVPAYLGKYTPTQLKSIQKGLTKVQNIQNKISQTVKRAKSITRNLAGLFGASFPSTKQQQAYVDLASLMEAKSIVSVDTPYTFFPSMAIESIVMIQNESTKSWSDIRVTLKEIRTVEPLIQSKNNSGNDNDLANRSQTKTAGVGNVLTQTQAESKLNSI